MGPLVVNPANVMRANYLLQQAWLVRVKGDVARAWDLIQEGLEVKGLRGSPFPESLLSCAAAELRHTLGDERGAYQYLDRATFLADEMGSFTIRQIVKSIQSQLEFDQGREEHGQEALREAFAIGRARGLMFFPWWIPTVMARLCAKALEAKIEMEYVQDLIRKTKLSPVKSWSCRAWPWPVQVYTLGRFGIHLDGKPLPSRRKAPYRVLHLLKLIVTLGGQDIPVVRLVDTLWPDAEGDTAHETFHKTLQRLRGLLAYDQVISVRNGKLSLNGALCWVDALAFRMLMNDGAEADQALQKSRIQRSEQQVALYRGAFLKDDEMHEWTGPVRDRLRKEFVRAVEEVHEWHKTHARESEALTCLQQALSMDPLAEPLYPRLFKSFQALKRAEDAKSVWTSYRQNVIGVVRAEPSAEMQHLSQTLSSI
jgi:DNA-binding SARP family transcriptional activator